MKALFPIGSGHIELREQPVPKLGKGEILVRMRSCGICGTDIEKTRGETRTPQVLGHEVSGEVYAIGDGVEDHISGERVVVHHHVSCGDCYYCKSGDPTLCEQYQLTNIDPCGFAEYFRVPEQNVRRGGVIRLPRHLSFEEASFIEPLGCCLRSLSRIGDLQGKSAVVLGVGSTGVLMVQLLKSMSAHPIITSDVSRARLEFSTRIGADIAVNSSKEDLGDRVRIATDGRGADFAIVATGNVNALAESLQLVRRGGAINIFGMPSKDRKMQLDPSLLFIRETKIIPSYSTTEVEMRQAAELISSHKMKVTELISHRFELADAVEAFRVASDPERSVKVVVNN